jgi:hypothetical protein
MYLKPRRCATFYFFGNDDDGPFWITEGIMAERKEEKVVEGIKKG